jgi:hypothetical protein
MRIVVLQPKSENFEGEHPSHSETLTFSTSGSNKIDIKREEDSEPETFPVMKAESEVSCISVANDIS